MVSKMPPEKRGLISKTLGRTVDDPTLDVHRTGKPEHFRARQRQGNQPRILDRPARIDDAGSARSVVIIPPSPGVMFFTMWKLKAVMSAAAPNACAASSTTVRR
jgi:hypothetical protein